MEHSSHKSEGCLLYDLNTVIADKTESPALARRQQRAAEQLLDDERLTGDLTDTQARPLLEWATYQAALAAGDPACSDEEIDATIATIRRAVIRVGIMATDEHDGEQLVALVQQEFQKEG
jgi:hypothetical protein